MENWTSEWVQVVLTAVALAVAGVAAHVSWKAYRNSYRPIVRVVPLNEMGDSGDEWPVSGQIVLKNIGRGPAISIVIVKGAGRAPSDLVGEVDALEPLGQTYGPDFKESSRVGRVQLGLDQELIVGQQYRVFYVDTAGGWHETEFEVGDEGFRARIAHSRHEADIPTWIRERSQIAAGEYL